MQQLILSIFSYLSCLFMSIRLTLLYFFFFYFFSHTAIDLVMANVGYSGLRIYKDIIFLGCEGWAHNVLTGFKGFVITCVFFLHVWEFFGIGIYLIIITWIPFEYLLLFPDDWICLHFDFICMLFAMLIYWDFVFPQSVVGHMLLGGWRGWDVYWVSWIML